MDILVTDIIRGTSGQFNKFGFAPALDSVGQFAGVEVHIQIIGDTEDITRENLIKILEAQLQIHIDQMRTLDQVDRIGPALYVPSTVRAYAVNATRSTLEYIQVLKDRAKITYFMD